MKCHKIILSVMLVNTKQTKKKKHFIRNRYFVPNSFTAEIKTNNTEPAFKKKNYNNELIKSTQLQILNFNQI